MNSNEDSPKNLNIVSEEDDYFWAFSYFQEQLRIIKKCNDEFSKHLKIEDERLDEEIWKDSGIGFKNWIADVKEINKVRKISSYKNAILEFNTKNPFYKAVCESIDLMQSRDLVRVMSLVFLVTIFEEFLKKNLTISFRKRPEALRSCQKNLSYEELLKFNDILEAREGIIEKENAIVNEDIETISEYIQKKFGIDIAIISHEDGQKIHKHALTLLKIDKPYNWSDFKERFYRRNLIVHNSRFSQ